MADLQNTAEEDPKDAVMRKVMRRLVPFLAMVYAFNIIDRTNVGTAALQMNGDLHLSDRVFSTGYGIFFIGYFFFEVPSNLVLERVGARWWIARIMLSWGIISSCMMFVRNAPAFYTMRFLLGVAEAGFYPGIVLYLTYWVPAGVRARVMARFLSLQAVFGLVGGPLAGLLLRMDGVFGLRGWQWVFLMEGIPSIVLSIVTFRTLPDRPDHAEWLTQSEKSRLADTMRKDAQRLEQVEHFSLRSVFTEPRIAQLCAIFLITSIGGNAVGAFSSLYIKARSHWSDPMVATVGIIPAIVGAIAMSFASGHSDRTGHRRAHIVLGYLTAGLAYLACIHAPSAWFVVAAFALNSFGERIAAGSYWAVTANTLGLRAAAGGIAMINSIGNLGGFIGPRIMGELKQHTGSYTPGINMAAALVIAGAMISLLLPKPSKTQPDAEVQIAVAEIEFGLSAGIRTEPERRFARNLAAGDTWAPVPFDMLHHQVGASKVAHERPHAAVVHRVRHVTNQGCLHSGPHQPANAEGPPKHAHVGVHPHHQYQLDIPQLQQTVNLGSHVRHRIAGLDVDAVVLARPRHLFRHRACRYVVAARIGVVDRQQTLQIRVQPLPGLHVRRRHCTGSVVRKRPLHASLVERHRVAGGVDNHRAGAAQPMHKAIHRGHKLVHPALSARAPVMVPDVAQDGGHPAGFDS